MSRVDVTISVGKDSRDRIYEVAIICRALGFGHTSTHSDLGILVGSAELEDLPALLAVPGVVGIEMEEEGTFRGKRRSPSVSIRSGAALRVRRAPPPEFWR
jgi:hypothetical protein